jgi:hypothetical protein
MTSPDTFLCTFRHIVKDSYSPVGYNTYRFNVLSCSTMMSISLGILLLFHYSSNIYTIIVSPFHRDVIYKKHNRFLMSIQDCCTSVPIPVYQCTRIVVPVYQYQRYHIQCRKWFFLWVLIHLDLCINALRFQLHLACPNKIHHASSFPLFSELE